MKSLTWLRQMKHPWSILLVLTIAVCLFPQGYFITRIFLLFSIPVLWIYGIFLIRKHRQFAIPLLSVSVVLIVFLCIPGSEPDKTKLRTEYILNLKQYEGTVYVWGGENRLGIDCSGLVRNGLIKANFELGLMTLNPKLIRAAFRIWWYDCSALALREGYKNLTAPIFKAHNINSITISAMEPGDIAVTANGVHVLAYLGGNQWIEADPVVMRVILVETPSDNPWFTTPVHVLRWTQLM